jgi:hypothetical protein
MFVPTDKAGKVLEPSDEGYKDNEKNVCFMVLVIMNMIGMMKNVSLVRILVIKLYDIDLVSLTIENLITRYYGIFYSYYLIQKTIKLKL